jgi:hypothetical protein
MSAFSPLLLLALSAYHLTYTRGPGAETCPDEALLRGEVASRVGQIPFTEPADHLLVVEIHPLPAGGFEARIVLKKADGSALGSRTIATNSSDCRELLGALALGLTVIIDPFGAIAAAKAEEDKRRPVVHEPPAEPEIEAEPPPPLPRILPGLTVEVLGNVGLAPTPMAGGRFGAELSRGHASLGVEAQIDPPAAISAGGGQAQSMPVLFGVAPCAHVAWFAACALSQVGAMFNQGVGLSNARSTTTPFVDVGARAQADIHITSGLFLRPTFEVAVPLVRTQISVGAQAAWLSSPVIATLGVAAGIQLK